MREELYISCFTRICEKDINFFGNKKHFKEWSTINAEIEFCIFQTVSILKQKQYFY